MLDRIIRKYLCKPVLLVGSYIGYAYAVVDMLMILNEDHDVVALSLHQIPSESFIPHCVSAADTR